MLAACLPALPATRASACSHALKNPREAGLETQGIRELFEAWFDRDAAKFRSFFKPNFPPDSKRMDPEVEKGLLELHPTDPHAYEIFDRFFTDKNKDNRVRLIVNTDAGIVVACSEADMRVEIQPDCSGTPKLHLFVVDVVPGWPQKITHIATTDTVETDKFGIWTDGSA